MNHDFQHYQRGLVLLEQNRYEEAANEFRDLLAANPEDDQALNLLARCQMSLPQTEKDALATIGRAIGFNAQEPDHFIIQSLIQSRLDDPKTAIKSANEAIALDAAQPEAFSARAMAYTRQSQWAKAETDCRQALELDPDNDFAANLLANALRSQHKTEENTVRIESLLHDNPQDSFTHANAGWAALQAGDNKKADEHFRESLRLEPDSDFARSGLLETFKARSPFYRLYLKYCFFMQRFTGSTRTLFIIGFFFVYKFAQTQLTGNLAPLGLLVTVLYLFFVFWSWFASGIGNLLVLSDRMARLALRTTEKLDGAFVGGGVILGIGLTLGGILANLSIILIPGLMILASALPFAMTFTNDHSVGRVFYGVIGAALLLSAIITAGLTAATPPNALQDGPVPGMIIFAQLSFVGCMWLGVFGAMRK